MGEAGEQPTSILLEEHVASSEPARWHQAAADPSLNADLALALLRHRQLEAATVELLAQRQALLKDHRVLTYVVAHPSTPKHVSMPLVSRLFTLELLRLTLLPAVKPEIRVICERALLTRVSGISAGEKTALAKQATGTIASALLLEPEPQVAEAALNNYHLTEADVLKALRRDQVPTGFFRQLQRHGKWCTRLEVLAAMLAHQQMPADCARAIVARTPPIVLQQVVRQRRPRADVAKIIEERLGKR